MNNDITEIIIQYFNDLKSIRLYRNSDIITSRLSEKGYTVSPVDSTVERTYFFSFKTGFTFYLF